MPSGMPRTTTRPVAHAPASAVRSQRPVKKTQTGPSSTKPLRTTRRPIDAYTTAANDDQAIPSCHSTTPNG
jgi:hypothetical protein